MDTMTFGLFHNQESAENTINELSHRGFLPQDISIVMKNQTGELLERLREFGFSEKEASIYEKHIKAGSVLIGVTTIDTAGTVKQILQRYRAVKIRSVKKNTIKT